MELVVKPALLEFLREGCEFVALTLGHQRLETGLCGQRTGFDCTVRTLDARRIEEAGIVADQHATGESELRQRLQAAGGDGTGTVGDALAAFEELADFRMCLEALEFLIRREVGVLVA